MTRPPGPPAAPPPPEPFRDDIAAALADVEAAIADFRAEYGDRAPIMRTMDGGYILAGLLSTWARLKALCQP